MSRKTKTLAKSLHTVSVIVNVARSALANNLLADTPEAAVKATLNILGYDDAADPYDLAGVALKQLEKANA